MSKTKTLFTAEDAENAEILNSTRSHGVFNPNTRTHHRATEFLFLIPRSFLLVPLSTTNSDGDGFGSIAGSGA
jgi:hypothetical protein